MKKPIFVLLFHCLLGVIFQSCCSENDMATIIGSGGIMAVGIDVRTYHDINSLDRVDTIAGDFQIRQQFEMEYSNVFPMKDAMMASALALVTCPDKELVNDIVSTELLFSEPIEFLGDTIPANTDLIDHPTMASHITIEEEIANGSGLHFIFSEVFHADALLPNGNMEITVSSTTSDNLEVGSTITVFMDK